MMKINRLILLTVLCLSFIKTDAQQPADVLNKWSVQNPIEKIYLHCDRTHYLPGQTIWFKGYLYSDFLPDNRSTTLFVELSNASAVINRQVFPVFGGFVRGQVELPDTLQQGPYMLRAYTATMLNHDAGFLYKKILFVFKKARPANFTLDKEKPVVKLEFFPEGGSFVSGLSNSIAFKATDDNGLPVSVNGVIKKENGEKLTDFSSYHDGMGYFDLTAEEATNYYAVLNDDPSGQKYLLPTQTKEGVVFRIISNGPTKSFEILQRNDNPVFRAAYMIGQIQHHVVFKKMFNDNVNVNEMTGIIPVSRLSSGIMQVTVFNKDGLPLAERLTFVDNKEYLQAGELITDTLDFSERGKNHFTFSLRDTVSGSFSVSVTDADFEPVTRPENIFSGLLLTSDLKGYVHNPAYYFSANSDSVQTALDLLMMTNGWRRFKWERMLKDSLPVNAYPDQGYIHLSGNINLKDTRRPFAGKSLMAYIVSPGGGKNILMLTTDDKGSFHSDSLIFFGKSRILFTDIKGRKSKFIEVRMTNDSLDKQYPLPQNKRQDYILPDLMAQTEEKKMTNEYEAIAKAEGVMLEGITVKSSKKTPLEELEEKYVSPLFAGDANTTLDLTKDDLTPYRNILDYLQLRVNGLGIVKEVEGPGYTVTYRQTGTVSMMGSIPMTIFLDEVPTDADALASLPANQIALVKVFSSFAGAAGNAPGGVLAVYTKKGADLSTASSTGDMISYNGYSVLREFYSPDYRVKKAKDKPDNRVTLYWNPAMTANGIRPAIPIVFYNNDRTRRFKVVIEGMTFDGKLVMIEKLVTSKKAF